LATSTAPFAIGQRHLLARFGDALEGLADCAVCEARHSGLYGAAYWGRLGGCNRGRYALQISNIEPKPSPVKFNKNDSDSNGLSVI
jgi:hypothetical protein